MDVLHELDSMFDLVWKDAMVVFTITLIYEGSRLLAVGRQFREGVKTLLYGLSLLILMIAMAVWVSHMMGKVSDSFVGHTYSDLASDWGSSLSSGERESASRSYASVVFTGSGKMTRYFDKTSGWQPYCPTEKDVALRSESVVVQANLQQVKADASSSVLRWLTFGFISALVGWFAGRKERKALANPAVNTDAAR
jgi:hypothetical protein